MRAMVICWVLCLGCLSAMAQDFRIDTEIYIGKDKEQKLVAESLTIFTDGRIYDFSLSTDGLKTHEITLFEPQKGKITLMDPARKVRSILTTRDLLEMVNSIDAIASEEKDSLFAFCVNPSFDTKVTQLSEQGEELTQITLASGKITYVARGKKIDKAEAIKSYTHFADWSARLNTIRGQMPPRARLMVNLEIGANNILPTEVIRTIPAGRLFAKPSEARSKHLVNWSLSGTDQKRVEEAGVFLNDFMSVPIKEYLNVGSGSETAKK